MHAHRKVLLIPLLAGEHAGHVIVALIIKLWVEARSQLPEDREHLENEIANTLSKQDASRLQTAQDKRPPITHPHM